MHTLTIQSPADHRESMASCNFYLGFSNLQPTIFQKKIIQQCAVFFKQKSGCGNAMHTRSSASKLNHIKAMW